MLECAFHKLSTVTLSNSIAYNSPGIQIDNGTDVVLDIFAKKICNITTPYFIWLHYLKFLVQMIFQTAALFSIDLFSILLNT